MQALTDQHWHALGEREVLDLLETDADEGLDLFEAKHRREQYGANELTPATGTGSWKRFAKQLLNPLVFILILAGTVTVVLKDWVDSVVIFVVVVVNAVVGFVQEERAGAAIEALARSMTAEATVVRGGEQLRLVSGELVPGDLVLLQAGDKVPADLRLLRARELRVDESALTGESLAVKKDERPRERECQLADRGDMAYASSLVTYGTGAGLVVATGDATEVGKISRLVHAVPDLKTPFTRKIDQFSRVLLYAIGGMAALTFVIGMLRGSEVVDMFKAAIALSVAAIPEGLPAAVTVMLAIGVSRMARRRAIVRNLPAVEALGSATVICTDKTGTLTENQMTVRRVYTVGASHEVSGGGYEPTGRIDPAPVGPAALETLRAGLLCNDTALVEADGRWEVAGDPTEAALLASASKAGLRRDDERAALPRLDAIPFESLYQYMATLHDAGDGRRVVYVKGSVEAVLGRCAAALDAAGEPAALDAAALTAAVEGIAAEGLRVLAFARREADDIGDALERDDVREGFTFLGLQAMMDPPRAEAVSAVRACREAGITVKMITGDHAVTAAAIAERIGLGEVGERALTGPEMAAMHDRELIEVVDRTNVFARVTPEQKLRLVEALQARGHVVAMTGDGVNDAPALKQANLGVAMGMTGTDVAKEAADMVLTDDNFATIEAAVEEGRGVFDNLVRFMAFSLPTNIGQGLVLITAIIVGATLPILPLQILWVNMVTDLLLGTWLAFELKEPGIMERPPRKPGWPILSRGVIIRVVTAGTMLLGGAFGLFAWAQSVGMSDPEARTVAVNVFMVTQLLYLFACRSLRRSLFTYSPFANRMIWLGVAVVIVLQLLFTYAPFMNTAFETAPIGGVAWAAVLVFGVTVLLVMDALGWVLRRFEIE